MNITELIPFRAQFLAEIRAFFAAAQVLEVDTALLRPYGVSDAQLHNLAADTGYLITSPEYAMKTLLCQGAPDIYQLSHVFRGEELGRKHRQEFMLLEWYRLGFDLPKLMQEVADLFAYLLKRPLPIRRRSYGELFQHYLHIDCFVISDADLAAFCGEKIPESRAWQLDRDGYLDLLFTHYIEAQLGKDCLEFVYAYPASQAALARLERNAAGQWVAARFEAYIDGIELCNGFHELGNAAEQRARFEADNRERAALGLPPIAIDEDFLQALEQGLPDCAGVAVGIDRLMMIAGNAEHIQEIQYVSTRRATHKASLYVLP